MDNRRNIFYALINGNADDLNRNDIREEFSKFGQVHKIYIPLDNSYAKVYFDKTENLLQACQKLNGFKSWEVILTQEEKFDRGQLDCELSKNSSTKSTIIENGYSDDMEEEQCSFAGNYVDVHGKPVEVLLAENGQMFVNLDDVRMAGFNVYKKESFENTAITRDIDLRHFENFLLNQGRKYVLEMKKTFNEDEMLGVFERVKAKLQGKSEFGEGRIINASPNMKNFSITAKVSSPPQRPPTELPDNFRPSFSHVKPQDYQKGPSPAVNGVRNNNQRNFRSNDDQRRPQDDNRSQGSNKSFNRNRGAGSGPHQGAGPGSYQGAGSGSYQGAGSGSHQGQMRRPKQYESRPSVNNNVNDEPEESWEGNKSAAPKSTPRNDSESGGSERTSLGNKSAVPKSTPRNDSESGGSERTSLGNKSAVPKSTPRNEPGFNGGERTPLNVERTRLAANAIHKIRVSYIMPDKKSLFYAQSLENVDQVQEILLHVNTIDKDLPEIAAPTRDMLCVACFEDIWYRAIVLNGNKYGGAHVEFIDYGNKEVIKTPLREMSEEMKKLPGMAIRVSVHMTPELEQTPFVTEQDMEVNVKKIITNDYDDETHLVEVKRFLETPKVDEELSTPPSEESSDLEVKKSTPTEECYTEIPPSTAKLTNGESVMIVGNTDSKFILRNKETAKNCKDVYTHLLEMEKKPITNPKVGQLVLCSRDGMEGLHRAVIKEINNQVAVLEYLDYYGGETLTLKSLRNVDRLLANYPSAKIESPKVNYLQNLSEKSENLIASLIANKTKLKVVLNGTNFDLLLTEGDKTIHLSQKIDELENPPKPKPVEQPKPSTSKEVPKAEPQPLPKKEEKKEPVPAASVAKAASSDGEYGDIEYSDMPFMEPEMGEAEYFCYSCTGDSVTLLSQAEDALNYLDELQIPEPTDTVPHEPEMCYMCLAKYSDVWYRAMVTEIGSDTVEVLFVDFGNTDKVPKSDIRKFPKKYAKIPILGINGCIIGIPNDPKVHEQVKELIPDTTSLKVNVKSGLNESLQYEIEIPSIMEELKRKKLI